MVKGMLPCTAMIGKETGAEMVMGVDSIEEGPRTDWKYDIESIEVDKCCEVVVGQCHTVIESRIQMQHANIKPIPTKAIRCFSMSQ